MQLLADRIIESSETTTRQNARAAAIDAQARSQEAQIRHQSFFGSKQHQDKLDAVEAIVGSFFRGVHCGIYRNHRGNRGNPFSTIKVSRPQFPMVSSKRKDAEFTKPLEALGVISKFSPGTNSWIFEVR